MSFILNVGICIGKFKFEFIFRSILWLLAGQTGVNIFVEPFLLVELRSVIAYKLCELCELDNVRVLAQRRMVLFGHTVNSFVQMHHLFNPRIYIYNTLIFV
jgi:hypothetical protein